MIPTKLRFRAAAICLAAVLVLSVLPTRTVYTVAGDLTDEQTEQTDSDYAQGEESALATLPEDQQETPSEPQEEAEEPVAPDGEQPTPADREADETEETAEPSDADGGQPMAVDEPEEESTEPDAADALPTDLDPASDPGDSVDLDALTKWAEENPDQLSAFYAGDDEVVAALAEILEATEEDVRTCAAALKAQNDILVQALEDGTDVLAILSGSTTDGTSDSTADDGADTTDPTDSTAAAAETLGVDEVAITLFRIKLDYVSGLLAEAKAEAEEADQLSAWTKQMGKALGDAGILAETAERYDTEPAVLAALLESMDIQPVTGVSITITNTVDEDAEGSYDTFTVSVYLWDPNGVDYGMAIVGTYGDARFTFQSVDTATASSMDIDGFTGGYYGYASLTFSAGQTREITGLPKGCSYFIMEGGNSDYYLTSISDTLGTADPMIGYICALGVTEDNEISFNYEYAPHSLQIGEEVISSDPESVNQEFTYTVYLYQYSSSGNTALFEEDEVSIDIDANGIEMYGIEAPDLGSTVTFTKTESITLPGISKAGVYNVATFTLKHGQSVVFKNLCESGSFGCYIVETPNIHYTVTQFKMKQIYRAGISQSMYTGTSHHEQYYYLNSCKMRGFVVFQNAQESLSITKEVENSDTTRDFLFNVFLVRYNPDTGAYYSLPEGDYEVEYTGRTGEDVPDSVYISVREDITRSPLRATNGSWSAAWSAVQVKVAAGQTITIKGLPAGIGFIVQEVPVTDYTTAVTETVNCGPLGSNGAYDLMVMDDAAVTFTNTYTPPAGKDLTVAKTVTGNMGDSNWPFTFQITLTDADGTPLSDRDIQVRLSDGKETVLTTDENGALTLELKDGQTATLENLPQGTQYTITEVGADSYTTSFMVTGGSADPSSGQTQSGALDDENDVTVSVTNDRTVTIPTGIGTEYLPFALALAVSAGTILLLLGTRRKRL